MNNKDQMNNLNQKQITVIGSLNMDLVVTADRLPIGGETIMGNGFSTIPGGKGANQAAAIARLGGNVHMIGRVGDDDFGQTLIRGLKHDGVNTEAIHVVENTSTGVALITVQASGENSIIVVAGANGKLTPADIEAEVERIGKSDVLVAQLETPLDGIIQAFAMAKGLESKESKVYTILNPAPARPLPEVLLANVDLLTPNESELALLSGKPVNHMDDVKEAAQVLFSRGVKEMVVTLGSEGAMYLNHEGRTHHQPAFKVKAVDTTAAGDSFTGALAVMLSEGKDIEEAMAFACKVGAITVQTLGAQSSLPHRAAVETFDSAAEVLE